MKAGILLSMALAAALAAPGVARADVGWSFGWSSGWAPPPVYRPAPVYRPYYAPPAYYAPAPRPWRPVRSREVCETVWKRQVFWRNGARITRDVPVNRCRWVGPGRW